MSRRLTIFNGRFDVLGFAEAADAIVALAAARRRGWIATVNVATLMTMRRDPALQSYVDRAALVVADGQPLVWCAPLFGGRLPERVAGIDLVEALCERAAARGLGVFLLGSTAPHVAAAVQALRGRHPRLAIDGLDGYFDDAGAAARAAAIRASGASILLVGMGSPRQERFIERFADAHGAAVAIGVGGSFDVIAEARLRAHPWLQRAGLEWLVRLAQEPRRLLGRYAVTNLAFCGLIARRVLERMVERTRP